MDALEALFRCYAGAKAARWWVGARPGVRDGRLAAAIAAQVGLPMGGARTLGGLVRLSRTEAADVLAVAGTTSLAYGSTAPRPSALADARNALASLTGDAVFLSNGRWQGDAIGWIPLTDATFDCGLIGHDGRTAFIFWVEEED